MKRIAAWILTLCLLCALLTACAEEKTIQGTLTVEAPVKAHYEDNPAVPGESPITGLPASGEAYTPIVITIDGNVASYPHWGVGDADILFQVPNMGGGDTKLMALFANRYPENAGAVRSARATMVPVAACFDAAYAYGGVPPIKGRAANIDVDNLMRKLGMRSAGKCFDLLGGKFQERVNFVSRNEKTLNLSAHVKEIHEYLVTNNTPFEVRAFRFTDAPLAEGESAEWIKLEHRGINRKNKALSRSTSTFTYDAAEGGYVHRNVEDGIDADRFTGETLIFANVIVLRAQIKVQTFIENDYLYFTNNMAGDGVAEFFQNGHYVRGAWHRDTETSRLVLVGPDGEEFPLQRGRSFIIFTNDVTDVTIR